MQMKFVLITILALFIFFCPTFADEDIKTSYESGKQLLEFGNLADAIKHLEQVYTKQSNYQSVRILLSDAYRFLGIDLYGNDRLDEALDAWKKAITLDPDNKEIQGFIERVQSELKAMRKMAGIVEDDTLQILPVPNSAIVSTPMKDTTQTLTAIASTSTDSEKSVPTESIDSVTNRPQKASIATHNYNRAFLHTELSSGLILPLSNGAADYRYGWSIMMGVAINLNNRRTGLRIKGIYGRLPQKETSTTTSSSNQDLCLIGIGLDVIFSFQVPVLSKVETMAGLGLYEITGNNRSGQLLAEFSARETKIGYSMGLGYKKAIGDWGLAVESRYLLLKKSFAPDMMQIRIILSTN